MANSPLDEQIYIPKNVDIPSDADMTTFLNSPSQVDLSLQPVVLSNIIIKDVIHTDSKGNSLIFSADKEYSGNVLPVNQPAYLLVTNQETGRVVAATNKFMLTQWQETRIEKVQIMETFDSSTLSWFDEKTKTYSFGGFLLEAEKNQTLAELEEGDESYVYLWAQSFRSLWNEKLRGTILVKEGNIATLTVMNNVLIGYPFALNITTTADNPNMTQFGFQFICTKHIQLNKKIKDLYDPARYSTTAQKLRGYEWQTKIEAILILLKKASEEQNYDKINQLKDLIQKLYTDPTSVSFDIINELKP